MRGHASIYEPIDHYLKEVTTDQLIINGHDIRPIERYNVAPTTRVEIIRPTEEGLSVDKVRWGWSPFWAKGDGKRPAPINARVETVMTAKYFKQLWPSGRPLAPANGWFEWVKDPNDPKKKQPYFIRRKEEGGRCDVLRRPGGSASGNGAGPAGWLCDHHRADSDQGMVDIHDRRPVVLSPEHAREWVAPETTPERATEIAKECCRPTEEFTWIEVSQDVGNVRNQGRQLIRRVPSSRLS